MNKKQKRKYYISNGSVKKVFLCYNFEDAVGALLEYISSSDIFSTYEIAMFSIVSEYGFIDDILAENNYKQMDKCRYIKTSDILKKFGYDDLANELIEFEKTLPVKQQKFLAAM